MLWTTSHHASCFRPVSVSFSLLSLLFWWWLDIMSPEGLVWRVCFCYYTHVSDTHDTSNQLRIFQSSFSAISKKYEKQIIQRTVYSHGISSEVIIFKSFPSSRFKIQTFAVQTATPKLSLNTLELLFLANTTIWFHMFITFGFGDHYLITWIWLSFLFLWV